MQLTNISPHSPDDVSQEPKRYNVNFASQYKFFFIYI